MSINQFERIAEQSNKWSGNGNMEWDRLDRCFRKSYDSGRSPLVCVAGITHAKHTHFGHEIVKFMSGTRSIEIFVADDRRSVCAIWNSKAKCQCSSHNADEIHGTLICCCCFFFRLFVAMAAVDRSELHSAYICVTLRLLCAIHRIYYNVTNAAHEL